MREKEIIREREIMSVYEKDYEGEKTKARGCEREEKQG
jgi:hypothetical protein